MKEKGRSSILVTGGCGFIGSNFVRYCLDNSHDISIVNADALIRGSNKENLRGLDRKRHSLYEVDITGKKIEPFVKTAETIVNFAAESHVDRSIKNPKSFLRNNVIGTFNILEYVRKYDKKLIHISTDEIYGSAPPGVSFRESDTLAPSNPYSASKASADLYVQSYANTYGIKTCILRCTNNFGPCQFPEKFIPKTVILSLLDKPVPIYGDGSQERDWIYVKDFCKAILMTLISNVTGKIYNVSASNNRPNIEVVKSILYLLKKPESLIKHVQDRPGHDVRYSLDSSLIRQELGWQPQFTFENALAETVAWYASNKGWWKRIISDSVLSETPWRSNN